MILDQELGSFTYQSYFTPQPNHEYLRNLQNPTYIMIAHEMIIYSLQIQDWEIYLWAKHLHKFLMKAIFKRQLSKIKETIKVS